MGEMAIAQADGYTDLKRMALTYNGNTVNFQVNPQNYSLTIPQRSTTVKSQGDNVNEQYGPDFPVIQVSGHTGRKRDGGGLSGAQRFHELAWLITAYQSASLNGSTPTSELVFYNYTDGYSYTVAIASGGFEYTRSVETPLLFTYSISMVVLKGADEPDKANATNPNLVTGGTGASISQGAATTAQNYANILTDSDARASQKQQAIDYFKNELSIAQSQAKAAK